MQEVRLITVTAACKTLALSRSALYGLMRSGRLPHVKIGRSRRLRLADVEALIKRGLVTSG